HRVSEAPGLQRADVIGDAVRDGGVDRDLREVPQDALVVGRSVLRAAYALHVVGVLEGAPHDLADPSHALRVRAQHRDHAEVVEASTLGSPASASRSGAWPPPAPSMWNAWTARPANAASVSATDSVSLSPSVWIASCVSWASQSRSAVSICGAPAPTSSWIF